MKKEPPGGNVPKRNPNIFKSVDVTYVFLCPRDHKCLLKCVLLLKMDEQVLTANEG